MTSAWRLSVENGDGAGDKTWGPFQGCHSLHQSLRRMDHSRNSLSTVEKWDPHSTKSINPVRSQHGSSQCSALSLCLPCFRKKKALFQGLRDGGQEHCVLTLQENWVRFPAPTWELMPTCNPNSRRIIAYLWSQWVPHTHGTLTYT